MNKFEAYIFDLDGTLVQTRNNYPYLITKWTLEKCNVIDLEFDDAEEFWFCPIERNKYIKDKWGVDPWLFWREFNALDEAYLKWCEQANIPYVFVYSDVYVLKQLQDQGKKLGCVTGCAGYAIEYKRNEIKKKTGAEFKSVIKANEGNNKTKPKPIGLQECLEELKVAPENACYVGDLAVDIQMAQAAGVFSILRESDRAKIPKDIKPDLKITCLSELL